MFFLALILLVIDVSLLPPRINAQCGCSGGQQIVTPFYWVGSGEQKLIERKRLIFDLLYKYHTTDKLYNKSEFKTGLVNFQNHNIHFFASYGISYFSAVDFNLGYSFRKLNQFGFSSKGYGPSNFSLGFRQNIYESEKSNILLNIGAGVRFPLMKFKPIETHPLVVQPSDGSIGLYANFLLQKTFIEIGLQCMLYSRFDYNFKNSLNYKFSSPIFGSLIVSKRLNPNFFLIAEIRGETRGRDYYNDTIYPNSGGYTLFFSPRINYFLGEFGLSPFLEFPIKQYFWGEQIGFNIMFGLNISYTINFARRKL
ncbi:MAG: hypothetical protein N2517_08785 [Ignavibacteria bacterium]|nr:hypothetical protein [Ignavibacteria bacterium]